MEPCTPVAAPCVPPAPPLMGCWEPPRAPKSTEGMERGAEDGVRGLWEAPQPPQSSRARAWPRGCPGGRRKTLMLPKACPACSPGLLLCFWEGRG